MIINVGDQVYSELTGGRWTVDCLEDGLHGNQTIYLRDEDGLLASVRPSTLQLGFVVEHQPAQPAQPAAPTYAESVRTTGMFLRERLARHFNLSANAPEDLIFETAAKSWDGTLGELAQWKRRHADAIAQLNAVQANRNQLADEMGEIAHENGLLTEENRDLLAENARLRRGAR